MTTIHHIPNTDLTDPDGTLTPPNDRAAEVACLGGMLTDPSVIDDVADIVTGPDFYRPAHETVFKTILEAHWSGEPVDPLTITDMLRDRGLLDRVGGPVALHEMVQACPVSLNAPHYAEIVAETAIRRRLATAGKRITALGYSQGEGDPSTLVAKAQAEVDAVDARQRVDLVAGVDVAREVLTELEAPDLSRALSLPWPSLTRALTGLAPGRVYVIGARPGIGKTAVALQIALWVMQKHHRSVAFSTLEMPRQEIITRMLSAMSGVPLTAGALQDFQRALVADAARTLGTLPNIFVDDREQVDPGMVRSHARAAKLRSDLGLVVIDYLQLMEGGDRAENRQQEVARFSRQVKQLARALDVPVLLLSQLNRASEHRGEKAPPRLADLRDSGAVEQDADVVLLLHRPNPDTNDLDMLVAKNRQGPRDVCARLRLDGARMTVVERQPWPHELEVGR